LNYIRHRHDLSQRDRDNAGRQQRAGREHCQHQNPENETLSYVLKIRHVYLSTES